MQIHVQYLTDHSGARTAVQVPFLEWQKFIAEYDSLRKRAKLKDGLRDALSEAGDIRSGKKKPVTLKSFIDEL